MQVLPGETVAEPEVEARVGYKFDGWYNGTYKWDFDVDVVPAEGVALFATWVAETYNVVFNYRNADIDEDIDENTIYNTTVQFDWSIVAPADPSCYQYQFAGWYTDPEPTVDSELYTFDPIGEGDMPASGTIYLYARWIYIRTVAIVNYYSAAPAYDGDEEPFYTEELILEQGAVAPTPESIYSYTHTGNWYVKDEGFVGSSMAGNDKFTAAYDFETTYPDIDDDVDPLVVNLYAEWEVSKYTITFNANNTDVTVVPDPVEGIEHGKSYDDVYLELGLDAEIGVYGVDDDLNGYIFDGWYYDSKCEDGTEFDQTQELTEDVTLYAKWDKDDITITLVLNNGLDADEVGGFETITKSYSTTDGYGFLDESELSVTYTDHTIMSWHTNANLATSSTYDFTLPLTADVTLYARWWDDKLEHMTISTASDLAFFRDMVNAGKSYSMDITLGADIDLGDVCSADLGNWTSIGSSTSYCYSGTFDGDGHTISNLYYNGSGGTTGGLFAYLGGGAVVKNLTMDNPYAYTTSSGIGAVACGITTGGAYIYDCIVLSGTVRGANQAGGILGNCVGYYVLIEGCQNRGASVTAGTNFAGGIVGRFYGSSTTSPQMINCYNEGVVKAASFAGGMSASAEYSAEIIGCYNAGTVTATAVGNEGGGAGGIVALSGWNNATLAAGGCKILSCYNTGAVTAARDGGGIMGYARRGYVDIISCYNTGTVTYSSTYTKMFGGIIGGYNSGEDLVELTLTSNYFVDDDSDSATLGLGGYTETGSGSTDDDVTEGGDTGATPLSAISELSSCLDEMNAASETYFVDGLEYSYYYQFVTGDSDIPTVEKVEVEADDDSDDE